MDLKIPSIKGNQMTTRQQLKYKLTKKENLEILLKIKNNKHLNILSQGQSHVAVVPPVFEQLLMACFNNSPSLYFLTFCPPSYALLFLHPHLPAISLAHTCQYHLYVSRNKV